MQTSTLMLALAASASAAVIRRDTSPSFFVSEFYAESIFAGNGSDYGITLNVVDGPSTNCTVTSPVEGYSTYCQDQGKGVDYAPAINGFQAFPCFDEAFSWSFTKAQSPTAPPQNGYILSLNYTQPSGEVLTGCQFVYESDFFCSGQPDNRGMDGENYSDYNYTLTTSSTNNQCVFA